MEKLTTRMIMRTNLKFQDGHIVFPPPENKSVTILDLHPSNLEDSGFIFYSHNNEIICHIGIRTDRRACELSYGTEDAYRGNGYMQEAMETVLQILEENHVVDEISGLICNNPISEHILVKWGFVQGKTIRMVANGIFVNSF